MSKLRSLLWNACDQRKAGVNGRTGKPVGVRHVIVLKNEHCYRHCLRQLKSLGIKPVKTVKTLHSVICTFGPKADLKALRSHDMVKRVEFDRKMKLHLYTKPHKPFSSPLSAGCASIRTKQIVPWGIARIQAPGTWSKTEGQGIRVAVLDTGISRTHPDLQVAGSYNAISNRPVKDLNGHGTHVAGTIAALNNSFGLVGAAPKVKLYAVKSFDKTGSAYTSDIVQGLDWCIRHNMNVINMSFGMEGESGSIKELIRRAYRKGIVLVASAGNSGKDSGAIDFPARLQEVIAVAAANKNNKIADFSSRGSGIALAAPGVGICSTYPGKTYRSLDGTSMASPHVSGSAALLLSRKRSLSPSQIKGLLRQMTVKLSGYGEKDQGAGLLRLTSGSSASTAGPKKLRH